jgi:hypothetical protein
MSLSPGRVPDRRPLRAAACAAVAALACLASSGGPSSRAWAGEPAASAPAVAASPRLSALEQEIRHLERHLSSLRKARAELTAGRPEPVPVDDDARRERDARQKALREVQRYESSRTKALARWSEAVASKDDAKTDEARAALDAVDKEFVASLEKVDEAASAKAPDKKDGDKKDGDAKPAPAKREGAAKRSRAKKTGAGGMTEEADGDDEDDDADEE